jgi:hypothetical protein
LVPPVLGSRDERFTGEQCFELALHVVGDHEVEDVALLPDEIADVDGG